VNILLFALLAWLATGLEMALPPVLDAGGSGVQPSFLIPLVVFVALHADARPALWSALVLGLLVDLIQPVALIDGGAATIPGPNALGFFLAAQMTLSVRGMVIRRNPLTLVVLSIVAAAVASVVVVAFMTLRGLFDPSLAWRGASELVPGLLSACYTGLTALVLSFPLFALTPFFGFPNLHAPRFARRD
jgi:cell shape-determining protein MreD